MVVVGKAQKPRAFKNINLPVHYYGQKSAWMTKDFFQKWFNECVVTEVRKWLKDHNFPQKALLLLDNASGHSSEEELATEDKSITVMFLPPNCTVLIQPMDQHIIRFVKQDYKKNQHQHIIQFVKQDYKKNLLIRAVSKDQSIEKTLKELNMKDLVFALCQSWKSLPQSLITSSWKKIWPDIVNNPSHDLQISVSSEVIQQVAKATQLSSEDLKIWCDGMDKNENIFHEMTDEEIIDNVSSSNTINEEDDDDVFPNTPTVTTKEAVNAFDMGLQWAEENGVSYKELLLLRRQRDKALILLLQNELAGSQL